ncbi:hypothetical protein P700755_25071 [Candidatus Moduliflexus flocculans]|uniref:Glycosyltransferase n=1 Tax=Candidatus Moduliflexus flocculans TaxID=1499966 RepID=A0A081BQS0_9BACT|nr:hypothetical protein P700755_25071 [Candidatus Moduliflexus flocculans]
MTRLLIFNLATDADDSALGFAVTWLAEFAKHVEAIDVMTMRAGHFELPSHVRVYSVGKEKGYSEFRRVVEFYWLLFRLLRQYRYDACFAHMMPLFAVMAAPILRLKKIPIVLWYAHKSVTPMLRIATWLVDRVVTSVPEGFRVKTEKLRIVGQGIPTDVFLPSNSWHVETSPFSIIMVGRISPFKRIDLLLTALTSLKRRDPEFECSVKIIGEPLTAIDQKYAERLRQQLRDEHIDELVQFTGKIAFSEIVPFYQQADCIVNLCPTGAIDKVVLEAMSCGVIPLVTNRSFQEVFGKEIAALCMSDDDSEQIASRLLAIHALSKETRQTVGAQLREIVVRSHSLVALCQTILYEITNESA